MSVKVQTFRKPNHGEDYAASVLEVKEWAADFADLRIEFGAERRFRLNPLCKQRPKIEGRIIVSAGINRGLRPWLLFYPVSAAEYGDRARRQFQTEIFPLLKEWIEEGLAKGEDRIIGEELLLVELKDGKLVTHRLRYL